MAPDGEPVTVDLILVITLPAELPLTSYTLEAGTVTDFTCVKLGKRQLLCLANGIETTNYLTTVSTVASDWGDVSQASMLVIAGDNVAGMSAQVATAGGKWFLPWVAKRQGQIMDNWSTEIPTELGFYWAINNGGHVRAVRLAWKYDDPLNVLTVMEFGESREKWRKLEPGEYTHWIGPIHQPKAPSGVSDENRRRYLERVEGQI